MKKGKKVLFIVPNLRIGTGVTNVVMNHYQSLIDAGYQIDFCTLQNRETPYIALITQNQGGVFTMPSGKNGYPDKKETPKFIDSVIRNGGYDMIHTHITGRYAVCAGFYAKKNGVKIRIYHSHNPRDIYDLRSMIASTIYDNLSVGFHNEYLACSNDAGKSVFRKRKFSVVKNTINADLYEYNEEKRKQIRDDLGLNPSQIVIGTVGRLTFQKNPFYTISIFGEFHKRYPESKLIMVGSGDLDEQVKQYIKENKLEDAVLLLGNREDVPMLYSAMDLFLLPSRFEGLGIVYIEAQAAGLPTIASDVVPQDTILTDLIKYVSLNKEIEKWVKEIELLLLNYPENRKKYASVIKEKEYDVNSNFDLPNKYNEFLNHKV